MIQRLVFLMLFWAALSSVSNAQPAKPPADREADRAAVRQEIETITQAFIDGDIQKIHDTHSEDWRGFLNTTQVPIKGIDEYMKANGIPYPPPASYKGPRPNPVAHFKITNFDVNFVSPDVGVANFLLDYPYADGSGFTRLRILDVFAKRNGKWIQVASDTKVDPTWQAEQNSTPANLNAQTRQRILETREAVWRAWFANDREKLEQMIPDEAIAINGSSSWENRAAIFEGAKKFAESGGKLTRLEFPRTELQAYGNTIILFTSYAYDTERNGEKHTSAGNGVETFVRRGRNFVNTGWILADVK